MNIYGRAYPLGESLPAPNTYLSPHELGTRALWGAQAIAATEPLNLGAAAKHMKAIAGLFNKGIIDYETYNRLPAQAQLASRNVATASYKYLETVNAEEVFLDQLYSVGPDGMPLWEQDGLLANHMQSHTQIAAEIEGPLLDYAKERFEGFKPEDKAEFLPIFLAQERAEAMLAHDILYEPAGIRSVLLTFGQNLGPLVMGLQDAASPTIDRRVIIQEPSTDIYEASLALG